MTCILIQCLIGLLAPQTPSIGAGLSNGVTLVYESNGIAQAPWLYESVTLVERSEFDHCVLVTRAGQAARESCVRGDTLFERTGDAAHQPTRPIGPDMRFEVRGASGGVVAYQTGAMATRQITDGTEIVHFPTTILTRDPEGAAIRRLREEYAPSLLTALHGVFEEPDGNGGWRTVQEFTLTGIRDPEPRR